MMMCENKPGAEVELKHEATGAVVRYRIGSERDRRLMNIRVAKAIREIEDEPERNLVVCEVAIRCFVLSVENCTGRSGEIKTAEDLIEHGTTALVDAVAAEIIGAMTITEADQEKSEGSSVSPQQATPASTGTAESALPQGETSTETATEQATQTTNTQSAEG